MGYGTSLGTAHEDEISYVLEKGLTDKQLADRVEMSENQKSGDFQSRFYASDAPTMPLEASRKLTDALKQTGSTQVPEKVPETNFVDKLLGTNGAERFQTWPEKVGRSMLGGMALPGDVYQGKEDPGSIQAIERAADLATLAVMGPAPLAKKMAEGTLGSFAGVTSKGADKAALEVAQVAEKGGLTADEIWQKTGWFRGTDKRWRYEIDDSSSTLKTPELKKQELGNYQTKLGSLLDHPELYAAYPGLENVNVNVLPWYHPKGAFWNGSSIGMGKEAAKDKGTLMHEVQHAIQDREAFAQGGVPGKVGKDYKLMYEDSVDALRKEYLNLQKLDSEGSALNPKEQYRLDYLKHVFNTYSKYARAGDIQARENYLALAGETEARNVETRLLLGPKDRLKINPLDTEDVPRADQIVRHTPTLTTPYKGNDGFLSYSGSDKSSSRMSAQVSSETQAKIDAAKNSEDISLIRNKGSWESANYSSGSKHHDFIFASKKGTGELKISEKQDGKELHVNWIGTDITNMTGKNDFGTSQMRRVLNQIKDEFPNAETITGFRVSGARQLTEAPRIRLRKPKE